VAGQFLLYTQPAENNSNAFKITGKTIAQKENKN
jgi:hypothetical protein